MFWSAATQHCIQDLQRNMCQCEVSPAESVPATAGSAQFGGQMTALWAQVRMLQASPTSGAKHSPVVHWHPVKLPSHTTAYAYLYRSGVGHGCARPEKYSALGLLTYFPPVLRRGSEYS